MKKNIKVPTTEELAIIKKLIPQLRSLQESYRGIQSLYPQYRGKEYARVFYIEGDLEYLDAIAFINYIELITT